jgi:hypothetical protein
MKSLTRIAPLLLVFWAWACQTSTIDLQPRPRAGARQEAKQEKVQRIIPRTKASKKLQPGDGLATQRDYFETVDGNDPNTGYVNEANSLIGQIESDGDPFYIEQTNAEVSQINSLSEQEFNLSIGNLVEWLKRIITEINQPNRGVIQVQFGNITHSSNWAQQLPPRKGQGRAMLGNAINPLTARQEEAFMCARERALNTINTTTGLVAGARSTNYVRVCCPNCIKDLLNEQGARIDIQVNKGIAFAEE